MAVTLDELKSTAALLPMSDRAELVHHPLHTLEPYEEGAQAAWHALAQARLAEVRAGLVAGVPAEMVLESMRRPQS